MSTRTFHIGALISVTGEKMMAPLDDIRALLDFMTCDTLMIHQMPLAADAVKPDLEAQHAWLKDVAVPEELSGEVACLAWLKTAADTWGADHAVQASPMSWGRHNPITDYVNQGGSAEIILVESPGEPS